MGRIKNALIDAGLVSPNGHESRTLVRGRVAEAFFPSSKTPLPSVSETTALRIADVFAAVRVLADGLAGLPLKAYRRAPQGRVPAGDDARIARLLRSPSPGTTSADLISQIVIDISVSGTAFLAKYRSDGEVVQLGTLPPDQVQVEQRGSRIIFKLTRAEGVSEHGPEDVVAIRGASRDGLRGLSPVRQCARALQINQGLLDYAGAWLANSGRPSGIIAPAEANGVLTTPGADDVADAKDRVEEEFSVVDQRTGRIMVLSAPISFERVEPAMRDQEFLGQREWSVRETARIFGIPPFKLGVSAGDSLTYSTVSQMNRAFVDDSLRPLAVRVERAISGDPDLCPGGTYIAFSFDALLRGDTRERFAAYQTAIEAGFLSVEEVRELEDLPRRPDA